MTTPSGVPPNELKPTASDFPVTVAAEVVAGAELDVPAGVAIDTLVAGTEVFPVDFADSVLLIVLVLDAIVTLSVDVGTVLVVVTTAVLEGAVLAMLVSECATPVPAVSWWGGGKH